MNHIIVTMANLFNQKQSMTLFDIIHHFNINQVKIEMKVFVNPYTYSLTNNQIEYTKPHSHRSSKLP